MQRLFSIFPTGAAGIGLFVLRSVVAVTVVVNICIVSPIHVMFIAGGVGTILGLCLLTGFLTPYAAAVTCVVDCALMVAASDALQGFHIGTSALTAAAAALLGPGAYSLDSRLFGRRKLTIPPGRES